MAITPHVLAQLAKAGIEVIIESDAGAAAGFTDSEYADKGATVSDRPTVFAKADVVVGIRGLGANPDGGDADLAQLREGQVFLAMLDPLGTPQKVADAAERGITAFALELVPRTTRAQAMDVLSSQASIAGYKAVLLAAESLPKIFPMMMTAAGTIAPAHVFVIGAAVAGLQAIATARRLGAVVHAYDIRDAAREAVESLGAKFVALSIDAEEAEGSGGYAKAQGEDFLARQRELMKEVIAESDVVITTAAIPGRPAPTLVTEDMVAGMAPGSVIVDVAAERGGNCALTKPGETVETGGVRILGPIDLPSSVPFHASQMFAKNVFAFLKLISKDGELTIDLEDDIVAESLVARDGKVASERVRELLEAPAA